MATELLSTIAAALPQVFDEKIARQYNRSAAITQFLSFVDGGGKNIAWDAEFSGASAAAFSEGSDVTDGEMTTDIAVPASLGWGHYRSAFRISDTEISVALSSRGGAMELVNILGERMLNSVHKLAQIIGTDIISGDGTDSSNNPTIVGLLGGSLGATGTYATIDRATYTEWAGNVLANGGVARPLTVDLLNRMDKLIFDASGLSTDLIVGSSGVFQKYAGLFEPIRRISNDGGGPLSYNTGSDRLFFKGIPVVRDRNMTAGTMIFLNRSTIELKNLPQNGIPGQSVGQGMLVASNGEGSQQTGIRYVVTPLAKNGDSTRMQLTAKLQLKVSRPNANGYISDISET